MEVADNRRKEEQEEEGEEGERLVNRGGRWKVGEEEEEKGKEWYKED